ncbi:MAG TPA: hypothetical protein PLQ19_07595 [Aeromicrobium sp.]|nr:hypothetical protein [Aeromicrobium sp.]
MTTVDVFVDRAGAPHLVGQAHFTRQRGRLSTTFLYDTGYLVNVWTTWTSCSASATTLAKERCGSGRSERTYSWGHRPACPS